MTQYEWIKDSANRIKQNVAYIEYTKKDNHITIVRIFVLPPFRKQGYLKYSLKHFIKKFKQYNIHTTICPDRKPNNEYNHELHQKMINIFVKLGFTPYQEQDEIYWDQLYLPNWDQLSLNN